MNPTVVALYSDSEILWMKLEPTSLLLTLLLEYWADVTAVVVPEVLQKIDWILFSDYIVN